MLNFNVDVLTAYCKDAYFKIYQNSNILVDEGFKEDLKISTFDYEIERISIVNGILEVDVR